MSGQYGRVEPAAFDQRQQLWNRARVHEPSRDCDISDPELLEVKGGRLAMHANIGERPAGADELRSQLECGRNSDRFYSDIGAKAAGELEDHLDRIFAAVVDRDIGPEFLGLSEPAVIQVDHNDASGGVELRGHDRREPDRARADDRHGVSRPHSAVLHAHFERGRQDVGQEEDLLISKARRNLVERVVSERDSGVLRLQPVDQMAENPATSAGALAVVSLLAKSAAAARSDTRNQNVVADLELGDSGACLDDRAYSLVAEDRAWLHRRNVTLEDVQVGATNGGHVDLDYRVGRR